MPASSWWVAEPGWDRRSPGPGPASLSTRLWSQGKHGCPRLLGALTGRWRHSDSISSAGFEFDCWLNTSGWPPYLPDLSPGDSLMKPAEELAQLWVAKELDMKAIEAVAISSWKTYQLVYFLDKILQKSPLPPGKRSGRFLQHGQSRLPWAQLCAG